MTLQNAQHLGGFLCLHVYLCTCPPTKSSPNIREKEISLQIVSKSEYRITNWISRCLSYFQNIVLFCGRHPQSGVCLHSPGHRRLLGVPRLPLPQEKSCQKRHPVGRPELQHSLPGIPILFLCITTSLHYRYIARLIIRFPSQKGRHFYHLGAYLCATYELLWLRLCLYRSDKLR